MRNIFNLLQLFNFCLIGGGRCFDKEVFCLNLKRRNEAQNQQAREITELRLFLIDAVFWIHLHCPWQQSFPRLNNSCYHCLATTSWWMTPKMDNYHKSLWLCGEQRQKITAGKKQDETQFKVVCPVFRLTLLNLSNKVVDELFCGQELVGD